MDSPQRYLTSDQLAGLLGISRKALDGRVHAKRDTLQALGYIVIDGEELRRFKQATGLHSRAQWLALFPLEAVLLLARQ